MDRDFSQADSGGSAGPSYASTSAYANPGKLTIHLGVFDIPYANAPAKVQQAKKGKKAKPVKTSGTQTTGDVAEWLENKYGVMQTFADEMLPGIAVELEESLSIALENMLMGAPASSNPFAAAETNITAMFKTYIAEGEIEHAGIEGVPTQAALKGVNHRLKLNRGPARPSFLDTGLYQQSFVAWVE